MNVSPDRPPHEWPSFDEGFSRVVRVSGWGLGLWAGITGKLSGQEIVALAAGYVGFEFVSRYRERKLPQLEERHDERP